MKLDEIDVLILQELQKDSRLSIRELSKRIIFHHHLLLKE